MYIINIFIMNHNYHIQKGVPLEKIPDKDRKAMGVDLQGYWDVIQKSIEDMYEFGMKGSLI